MGIRSTRTLTREDAEYLYVEFKLDSIRSGFEEEVKLLNNTELGDTLDEITTDIFSNYLVVDEE